MLFLYITSKLLHILAPLIVCKYQSVKTSILQYMHFV